MTKPPTCVGCPLRDSGRGFVLGDGPLDAALWLFGESLGKDEVREGRPFVGAAGSHLDRILRGPGLDRENLRIENIIRCQPPIPLDKLPYAFEAAHHCFREHLAPLLDGRAATGVALGNVAMRILLNLPRKAKGISLENFHRTVGRYQDWYIIPTYHPASMIRGDSANTWTAIHDLNRAIEVSQHGWNPEPATLHVDPPPEWFQEWAESYLEHYQEVWLAVDVETPTKLSKGDEDALEDDYGMHILRINFSDDPGMGITVPWYGAYIEISKKVLSSPGIKIFWNYPYDRLRLMKANCLPSGEILDGMDAFHVLNSTVRRSLGFVSPFYSDYGPWKHLSSSDPGTYAAIDPMQTIRSMYGIAEDLKAQGRWDLYFDRIHRVQKLAFFDMHDVGILMNPQRLDEFGELLEQEKKKLVDEIRPMIPEEILPLDGPKKKKPEKLLEGELAIEKETSILLRVCKTCGAEDVITRHRCKDGKGKPDKTREPQVELQELTRKRWFIQKPWNPDSVQQLKAYAKFKGHSLGRNHKTLQESLDKGVLDSLAKKDPIYAKVREYRKLAKAKGTYVDGMKKRMDKDGRVHPMHTRTPETLRSACVDPNWQNIMKREE